MQEDKAFPFLTSDGRDVIVIPMRMLRVIIPELPEDVWSRWEIEIVGETAILVSLEAGLAPPLRQVCSAGRPQVSGRPRCTLKTSAN